MQTTLRSAIADLKKGRSGSSVQLKCFVWLQGESDATIDKAPLYKANLQKLIGLMRSEYGSGFRIVLGVSETHPGVLAFPEIRSAQSQLAKELPGVRTTSTLGLPTVDGVHFTADAQLTLGERIFSSCFGMF